MSLRSLNAIPFISYPKEKSNEKRPIRIAIGILFFMVKLSLCRPHLINYIAADISQLVSNQKKKKASRFYCFSASIHKISKSFLGFRLGRHVLRLLLYSSKRGTERGRERTRSPVFFLLLLSWVWNLGPFGSLLTVRAGVSWLFNDDWHTKKYGSRFLKRAIRLYVGHHIHKYFIDQIKCEEFRHIMRTVGLVIMGHNS